MERRSGRWSKIDSGWSKLKAQSESGPATGDPGSLQGCLLVKLAYLKTRIHAEAANSFHQISETLPIFLNHCRDFQPQSTTGSHMPHNSLGPDLAFFDEKMKVCLCAYISGLARLDKQPA